jgi:chromosome segregation ATPase
MQNVIAHSQKQSEKLKTLVSDREELAALKRCIDDEKTENLHLEKVNVELQQQLEEQRKELEAQKHMYQEELKEQKKAHQGKPLLPSSTCTERLILDSEKLSTTELRRILMSKEELLTDVKNLLYRRTDDVERLQKVIGDTERQFVDGLQRIKMLGEELEDLKGAARELVDMVDPLEEGEVTTRPLLEWLREALKKILKFLSEAPVTGVNNALAIVKSFLPNAQLEIFAQGMAADCTEDQFDRYLLEAQPVSECIVQSVMQD